MINRNFALEKPCKVIYTLSHLLKYKQTNNAMARGGKKSPGMGQATLLPVGILSPGFTTKHRLNSKTNFSRLLFKLVTICTRCFQISVQVSQHAAFKLLPTCIFNIMPKGARNKKLGH